MKNIEPENILKKIFHKFDQNDLLILILTFCLGLINNFYFIIGEGIAPDALSPAFFNVAGNWEITLGRFAIKYINMARYGLVCKFLIILICLLFIAMAIMLLKRTFNIKNKILIVLLTCFVCIAPQFTETYMFIYCADAYLVAFFLSSLSVYFLNKTGDKKYFYVLSLICVMIVCALYQAYLGVIVGLTILLTIKYIIDGVEIDKVIKKFVNFMAIIFIGIVVYYILLKIILSYLGLSLASYKGANSLGIETVKNIPKGIAQCFKDFYSYFFNDNIINNSYYKRKKMYLILFMAMLFAGLYSFYKSNLKQKNIRFAIIVFLTIIFSIGVSVMNLIASGTTINLVTGPGIITWTLYIILIYKFLPKGTISSLLKWVIILTSLSLIWTYLLENSFTYIAREQTYKNYYTISSDIYTKVVSLEDYSDDKKWLFSDVIRFKVRDLERSNGFISHDNETWNNYSGLLQNSNFYEKHLGIKIKIASTEEYRKIVNTEEFKNMSIYPKDGSIKIIDDIIVIKISEKTF